MSMSPSSSSVNTNTSTSPAPHQTSPPLHSLLAGGLSGMIAKSFVAPLDRLKILFQVTNMPFSFLACKRVATKLVSDDGLSALWKGNGVMMLRVFPYAGIQFCVFDTLKSIFADPASNSTLRNMSHTSQSLMAGSTAGLVSTVATYPLDLCRARLAVMRNSSAASTATFPLIVKGIVAENGFRGLYLGITPTLAGMMPYAGLAFTMNDHLRRLVKTTTGKDVTTPQKLVAGGVSGLVAQSLTYPLDVTRRRMQTTGLVFTDLLNGKVETTEQAGKKQKTPTITNVMRAVFAEQGMRGLFKGLTMNWVKGPMAFAVSFTMFDYIKARLDSIDPQRAANIGQGLKGRLSMRRMSVVETESDETVVVSLDPIMEEIAGDDEKARKRGEDKPSR